MHIMHITDADIFIDAPYWHSLGVSRIKQTTFNQLCTHLLSSTLQCGPFSFLFIIILSFGMSLCLFYAATVAAQTDLSDRLWQNLLTIQPLL